MLPRVTINAVADHIWPTGRYLPTPAIALLSSLKSYVTS